MESDCLCADAHELSFKCTAPGGRVARSLSAIRWASTLIDQALRNCCEGSKREVIAPIRSQRQELRCQSPSLRGSWFRGGMGEQWLCWVPKRRCRVHSPTVRRRPLCAELHGSAQR